jgi:hypothetical protein
MIFFLPAGDLREGLDGAFVDKSQALVGIVPDYGFMPNKAFMQHSLLVPVGIPELRIVGKELTVVARLEVTGHFVQNA